MDTAHQPALNYLPYLVTGSQYYLDGLMAQSAYSIAACPPLPGLGDGFVDFDQVRGRAWTWRNMSDSAFIAPDDSEMKSYFTDMLENNLDALVKRYITTGVWTSTARSRASSAMTCGPTATCWSGSPTSWRWSSVRSPSAAIAKRSNC